MSEQRVVKALDVYLKNILVGKIYNNKGELSFKYDSDYLSSSESIKISSSMPLCDDIFSHQATSAFFSGLLPDEGVRVRLAKCLGVSSKNTFGLLKAIGGECAGAISVYPEGDTPNTYDGFNYRVLDDDEADMILSSLSRKPMMAGEEDIRISGAGAQDKLVISFIDGKISIPKGNAPSTHIIKPAIDGYEDTVFNEYFCMKLAGLVSISTPKVEILWLKGKPYYLVERFDRIKDSTGNITRLHQEDFCQALQVPPEVKYESEGGPSLIQCFKLLDSRISDGYMAGVNTLRFLKVVIFNYLIGNGDAHGKNFSILYKGQSEALSPVYDILSTKIYSNPHKAKMAMKLSGKYKFKDVSINQWKELAKSIGFREDYVISHVAKIKKEVLYKSKELMNELNANSLYKSSIYERIVESI